MYFEGVVYFDQRTGCGARVCWSKYTTHTLCPYPLAYVQNPQPFLSRKGQEGAINFYNFLLSPQLPK